MKRFVNDNKNLKFVIYARKSTEGEDRQMASLPDQLNTAEDIAKQYGYKVVKTFKESGSASKVNNRPQFNEMVKMIKAGKANAIICWKINRLARNMKEGGVIHQLLIDGKIQVIHTKERIYRPEDNALVFAVEASIAAQYSRDLSLDVTRGIHSKNRNGGCTGVAPIGYLNTRDDDNKPNISPDPERFSVIKRIFELCLSGNYSVPELLDILNNDYHLLTRKTKKKGGRPLTIGGLHGVLSNPFYMGKVRDFENPSQFNQGSWEPMITEDQFWRVQRIVSQYAKNHNLRPKTLVESRRYELKGMLSCASCNCAVIGELHDRPLADGTTSHHLYYRCTRKSTTRKCTIKGGISEEEAFRQIDALLDKYTLNPLLYEWAMEILDKIRDRELLQRYDVAKTQNATIDDYEKQLHELVTMRTRGIISDELFEKEAKQYEKMIEDVKQAHRDTEERNRNWYEVIGKTLNTLKSPKEKFHIAENVGERRAILLAIGPKAVLNEKRNERGDLTDKIIEIKPYKWVQYMTENGRKIENDFLAGDLTTKSPPKQGENSGKTSPYKLWSGRPDSNRRPLRPKRSALPTVPRPDVYIIS